MSVDKIISNIEKVAGESVAELIEDEISKEELHDYAEGVITELKKDRGSWGYKEDSKFKSVVKKEFSKALCEEIESILKSEEYVKIRKEMAQDMVDEILEETRNKLVDKISDGLAGFITNPQEYSGYSISSMFNDFLEGNRNY